MVGQLPTAAAPLQLVRPSTAMLALGIIVLAGAALRITWNDVAAYGPDEIEYVNIARAVSADPTRYGGLVRSFVASPDRWGLPLPTRWGGVALTSAACVVAPCTPRTLAWLETLAGVVAIGLTCAVARTVLGLTPALLAAALSVTSPIQLGMGRRALEDELFAVAVLLAMWTTLRLAGRGGSRGDAFLIVVGALGAFTFAFAVKETFIFYYPALAALLLMARGSRRPRPVDVAVFALAPVIYAGVLGLFTGDFGIVGNLVKIEQAVRASPYVVQFQSGPFWEPLLDVYVLAPVVTLAAIATGVAAGRRLGTTESGVGALVGFGVLLLVAYGFIPKDARYFIPADATARMLAAWCVLLLGPVRRELAVAIVGIAILNGIVELPIFNSVFLRAQVYDPVIANLLHPLGMTP